MFIRCNAKQEAPFTADILTCYGTKSTGVTNNINDCSVLFKCLTKLWKCDSDYALPTVTCNYIFDEKAYTIQTLEKCTLEIN